MELRRNYVNNKLIYVTLLFALVTYLYLFTNLIMFLSTQIFITVASFIGICFLNFGYRFICNRLKKKYSLRINFIYGCVYLVNILAIIALSFISMVVLYAIISSGALAESNSNSVDFIDIYQLSFVYGISIALFIFAINHFRNDKYNYHYVAFSYLFHLIALITILSYLFVTLSNVIPITLALVAIIIFSSSLIIGSLHFPIVLFNISSEKRFIDIDKEVKVFIIGLFKKNVGYYIGIFFVLITGILYIMLAFDDTYLQYVGYFFIFMSVLRLLDHIWLKNIRSGNKKKRYFHQYIIMLTNGIVISSAIFLIWKVLDSVKKTGDMVFNTITVVFGVILAIRIVFVIIGYYYSRINVKKEPFFIVINNLSMISLFVSLYAFIVPFLFDMQIDRNQMINFLSVFSIVIIVLISLVILLMIIRSLIGLYKIKHMEE